MPTISQTLSRWSAFFLVCLTARVVSPFLSTLQCRRFLHLDSLHRTDGTFVLVCFIPSPPFSVVFPSLSVSLLRYCFRSCRVYCADGTVRLVGGTSILIAFMKKRRHLPSVCARPYIFALRHALHSSILHLYGVPGMCSLSIYLSLFNIPYFLFVGRFFYTPCLYLRLCRTVAAPLPPSRFLFLPITSIFLPSPSFSFSLSFSIRDGYITRISIAIIICSCKIIWPITAVLLNYAYGFSVIKLINLCLFKRQNYSHLQRCYIHTSFSSF